MYICTQITTTKKNIMKLTKEFLTANRNDIIEIAKDLMTENGFVYISLKDVLVMFSETATDQYTLLEEMQWVINQLKSKNNASYLIASEKIKIQSKLKQSINL